MRSSLLVVLLVLGACATPVRTVPGETMLPDGELELPTRYAAGYFLVRSEIDGRGPYWLLLDTGTDRLVVDASVGEEHAHALFTANMKVLGATGAATPMPSQLRVGSLKLGDAEFRDLDAGVLDLSHLSASLDLPVQGLLGCSIFANCLLTLDYPARRVRVGHGRLPPLDEGAMLLLGGSTPWIEATLAGRPMRFLLDTGFGREVAFPPVPDSVPLTHPPRRFGDVVTISGPHPQFLARVDGDLELGRYRVARPLATVSPGSPKIGARALRKFVLVLDLAGRRLRISQPGRPTRITGGDARRPSTAPGTPRTPHGSPAGPRARDAAYPAPLL